MPSATFQVTVASVSCDLAGQAATRPRNAFIKVRRVGGSV
jgi:hypothetical protein